MSAWARENDVELKILYAVLNGKNRAHRGEGHRIAVKLGLKLGTSEPLVIALAQGGLTDRTMNSQSMTSSETAEVLGLA